MVTKKSCGPMKSLYSIPWTYAKVLSKQSLQFLSCYEILLFCALVFKQTTFPGRNIFYFGHCQSVAWHFPIFTSLTSGPHVFQIGGFTCKNPRFLRKISVDSGSAVTMFWFIFRPNEDCLPTDFNWSWIFSLLFIYQSRLLGDPTLEQVTDFRLLLDEWIEAWRKQKSKSRTTSKK